MRKLLVILFILLFLLGLALAQQTQPAADNASAGAKIPVEFYYNAGNKQSQEIVKQLVEGMRFKDRVEIIYRDVGSNPEDALLVENAVKKLPEEERGYVDLLVLVGELRPVDNPSQFLEKNLFLFGSKHIARTLNQAILYKLGMGVEKPASFSAHKPVVNPFTELDKKLSEMQDNINSRLLQVILLVLFLIILTLYINIERMLRRRKS